MLWQARLGIIGSPAAALGPVPLSWTTTFSPTMTGDQGGWGGTTQRQLLDNALLSTSGSFVRVTFSASSSAGCDIDNVFIGHQAGAGDAYDFDGGQVRLLFSGLDGVTIGSNSVAVSDTAAFALDETKNLIIAIHYNTTSAIRGAAPSGATNYYKVGADDTSTTNASGYSLDGTFTCRAVSKIEVA